MLRILIYYTTLYNTLYTHSYIYIYICICHTTKFHDRLHIYIYCTAGSFWCVDWISYVPRPFASSKPLWRRIPRLISESHTALHTRTLLGWRCFFLTIEAHVIISRIRYLHGTCTLDTFACRWMYPSFCQVQDKGIAFIPDSWSTKFKPVLGPLSWFGLHAFSTSIAWSVNAPPIHESQGHIENLQGAQFFLELGEARFHRTVTQSVEVCWSCAHWLKTKGLHWRFPILPRSSSQSRELEPTFWAKVESNECFQVQPTTPSNFIIKVVEGADLDPGCYGKLRVWVSYFNGQK